MKESNKVILCILSFICGIRVLPLWLLWRMMILFNNCDAQKFVEDLKMAKSNFFMTMYQKPQYKSLLYARLGRISYPLKLICGSYPITIDSKHKMSLGKGVWMEHPHGSHIHAKSVGDYLTIKQNVCIGMNHGQLPIIGNHVFCGVGSCILGGVTIGDNVNIGANAVILKDVPANSTVVGNPAIIVKQNGIRVNIPL